MVTLGLMRRHETHRGAMVTDKADREGVEPRNVTDRSWPRGSSPSQATAVSAISDRDLVQRLLELPTGSRGEC